MEYNARLDVGDGSKEIIITEKNRKSQKRLSLHVS